MPQQLKTSFPEQQRSPSSATRPNLARSPHIRTPSPLVQLQQVLGNSHLARLFQAGRVDPQGHIIGIQPKLTVGAPNDQYEQEADRVARQVMTMPDPSGGMQRNVSSEEDKEKNKVLQTKPLAGAIAPLVQRELVGGGKVPDKDEEVPVQAKYVEGGSELQRQPGMEEEEQEPVQAQFIQKTESLADSFDASANVESGIGRSKGGGSPLPDTVRTFMEPRFGIDFSHVRVHTGSEAMQLNREIGAKAFTHGSDIYYGAGHGPPIWS